MGDLPQYFKFVRWMLTSSLNNCTSHLKFNLSDDYRAGAHKPVLVRKGDFCQLLFAFFFRLPLNMDYVYSSHLFNEISLKFTMYYLSVNFFFIYSFLKMTSEVLRLWLCTYVEDQGCQAMNNLNEMLRSKTSPLTLYTK